MHRCVCVNVCALILRILDMRHRLKFRHLHKGVTNFLSRWLTNTSLPLAYNPYLGKRYSTLLFGWAIWPTNLLLQALGTINKFTVDFNYLLFEKLQSVWQIFLERKEHFTEKQMMFLQYACETKIAKYYVWSQFCQLSRLLILRVIMANKIKCATVFSKRSTSLWQYLEFLILRNFLRWHNSTFTSTACS